MSRDPVLAELLDEVDEIAGAVIDLAVIIAELPAPVNMERLAVIRDRVDAARDAVREMREQNGGDEE